MTNEQIEHARAAAQRLRHRSLDRRIVLDAAGTIDKLCAALEVAKDEPAQPFGYFRAVSLGWTDCAETDQGAIPLYEKPQPPDEWNARGLLAKSLKCWHRLTEEESDELAAFVASVQPKTELVQYGWLRAVDEEMVGAHIGVANLSDSYESAKAKLHSLIQWHLELTGYMAKAELVQEPIGEIVCEDMGRPFNAMRVTTHFYKKIPPVGAKLYAAPQTRQSKAEPVQEPIAYCNDKVLHGDIGDCASVSAIRYWSNGDWIDKRRIEDMRNALYAAPQTRQPLTDEQIEHVWDQSHADDGSQPDHFEFARAIEAAIQAQPVQARLVEANKTMDHFGDVNKMVPLAGRTCIQCKRYQGPGKQDRNFDGKCTLLTGWAGQDAVEDGAAAWDYEDYSCGVNVGPKFGCIHWEQK